MPNTYVTVERMISGLGSEQLTRILDLAPESDVSGNASLLQKILWANGIIDSYLRGSVPLPLPGDPLAPGFFPELIEHGVNIALWGLVNNRRDVRSEEDHTRYRDAISYLKDISEGRSNLDLSHGVGEIPCGAKVARVNEKTYSDWIGIVPKHCPERYM